MNLCIIASGDYFSSYGGGQIYVKNLVLGLHAHGHDLHVVSVLSSPACSVPAYKIVDVDGIRVYQLTLPSESINLDLPYELQSFVLDALADLLSKITPDLIHAHGWKYAAAHVSKILHIPCIITAHHGGIVCPSGSLLNQDDQICNLNVSAQNCTACALHFVPGGDFWSPLVRLLPMTIAHSLAKSLKSIQNIPYISPAFQTPLGIAYKQQQIDILRQSEVNIIAPSQAIADALYRNGIERKAIHVIPHGITPLAHQPLKPFSDHHPIRFGYIGRISYVKGLHVLIDALNLLPNHANYELHVYGDAATKDEKRYALMLKEKSQSLPIIWHGKISNDSVQDAYHTFDIMVHPTICLEIFGLTLPEALSAGRPVIATRCGGPEDFIAEGIDGILVEPNDARSLSDALKKCIDNPEYVEKLSSTIRPINTLENHLTDIEELYKELLP